MDPQTAVFKDTGTLYLCAYEGYCAKGSIKSTVVEGKLRSKYLEVDVREESDGMA